MNHESTDGVARNWAQEIVDRVNFFGIADWVSQLALACGKPLEEILPSRPQPALDTFLPAHGLALSFSHPHANHVDEGDSQRWILTKAMFNLIARVPASDGSRFAVWRQKLPFDLDASQETPLSARSKLSDETDGGTRQAVAKGDRRVSFFLEDSRVVELTFRPGMTGLEMISVARLGREQLMTE